MLDYIFFHKELLDRFVAQLEQLAIPCETRDDSMGLVAAVPDDLDDAVVEQVDEIYEALLDDTEKLFDVDEPADEMQAAAISIKLKNGDSVDASINAALLKRILTVINYEELDELAKAIVDAVENPDHRPFCQR